VNRGLGSFANSNMKNFSNARFASIPARISRAALVFLLAGGCVLAAPVAEGAQEWNPQRVGSPLLPDPIWVYNNWSAYDELSDRIPLTEELAHSELPQAHNLRQFPHRPFGSNQNASIM